MNSLYFKIKKNKKTIVKKANPLWWLLSWGGRGAGAVATWALSHPFYTGAIGVTLYNDSLREGVFGMFGDDDSKTEQQKEELEDNIKSLKVYEKKLIQEYLNKYSEFVNDFSNEDESLRRVHDYVVKSSQDQSSDDLKILSLDFKKALDLFNDDFFKKNDPINPSGTLSSFLTSLKSDDDKLKASVINEAFKQKTKECSKAAPYERALKKEIREGNLKIIDLLKAHPPESMPNARSVKVDQKTREQKREEIFGEYSEILDPNSYARNIDEIINERYETPLASSPSEMMSFMQRLEAKILSKESGRRGKEKIFKEYSNSSIFDTAGKSVRGRQGHDGQKSRLYAILGMTDSRYKNLGENSDLRMEMLEIIIQNTDNNKIIEACEDMKSEIKSNEAKDHINYLKPNSLARLSKALTKTAAVDEGMLQSATDFFRNLKDIKKINGELPTFPTRTYSQWGSDAAKTLGTEGAHIESYYRMNEGDIESDIGFFEDNKEFFGIELSGTNRKKLGTIVKYICATTNFTETSKIERNPNNSYKIDDAGDIKILQPDSNAKNVIAILDNIFNFASDNEYSLDKIAESNATQTQGPDARVNNNQGEQSDQQGSELISSVNTADVDQDSILQTAFKLYCEEGTSQPLVLTEKEETTITTTTYTAKMVKRSYDGIGAFNSALTNLANDKGLKGNVFASNVSIAPKTSGGITLPESQFLNVGDQTKGGASNYLIENKSSGNMRSLYLAGFLQLKISKFVNHSTGTDEKTERNEVFVVFGTNLINAQTRNEYTINIGDGSTIPNYSSILIQTNFPISYPDLEKALGYSNIRTYSAEEFSSKKEGEGDQYKDLSAQSEWFLNVFKSFYNKDSKINVGFDIEALKAVFSDVKEKDYDRAFFQPDKKEGTAYSFKKLKEAKNSGQKLKHQFDMFSKYNPNAEKNFGSFNVSFIKKPGSVRDGISALTSEQKGYVNPFIVKNLYDNGKGQELRVYFKALAQLCFVQLNQNSIMKRTYQSSITKLESKLATLRTMAFS